MSPVEDVIAQRDRVVVRWTAKGTHKGKFRGIAPSGKRAEWMGISIYRISGARIVEEWVLQDMPGLMKDLSIARRE